MLNEKSMAAYSLESQWRLDGPVERIWDCLCHPERWASWWDNVERVEDIAQGGENGVGSVRRYVWKTLLPYRLVVDMEVTRVEHCRLLEVAVSGDLEGFGRCEIDPENDGALIRYLWQVRTRKAWMNWLAPVARPLFEWNHQAVMARGRAGLARMLESRETA